VAVQFLDTGGTSGPLYGMWFRALGREGAASTEAIAARHGRASYVGDVARGVLDPGAVTVALFFESAPVGGDPQ
jgi:hypothetical protein